MRSGPMVVGQIRGQQVAEMPVAQDDDVVVSENSADGLRGLAIIELEYAAEPLTALY
jgi:hypothetical protein